MTKPIRDARGEVHWLDARDRVECIGHTPIPGIAWTRKQDEITCEACHRHVHGAPPPLRDRVSPSSDQSQEFVNAVLGAYSTATASPWMRR